MGPKSGVDDITEDLEVATERQQAHLQLKSKSQCLSTRMKWGIGISTLVILGVTAGLLVYYLSPYKDWINVHLIAHTHDDVGWLNTPHSYYANRVKYILDHVVQELKKDNTRKFTYVESYYLWHWWQEQSEQTRADVLKLVSDGQLELSGGGWSMADEAVVHYHSFIDQTTLGLRFLNDTFGDVGKPHTAWQIDPFGHSRELASLMAQMGYSAVFFARIHLDDLAERKHQQLLEFLWKCSPNLKSQELFTNIMFKHYTPPREFDFEKTHEGDPVDLGHFVTYVREAAQYYRTPHVLVPMGNDFTYYNAKIWFDKMDNLIRSSADNEWYKVRIFYSTPMQYLQSIQEFEQPWPSYEGDFFPYADFRQAYWTGYYTSRPSLKYLERITNNFLQVCKQLYTVVGAPDWVLSRLEQLRQAMGVLQHHDAVTGTATQHVTDDYVQMTHRALTANQEPLAEVVSGLLTMLPAVQSPTLKLESCLLLNISECSVTETSDRFLVVVYNPLNWVVNHIVRLPVSRPMYVQTAPAEEQVLQQLVPVPKTVSSIPGRNSKATHELVFRVAVPAMGYKTFYVVPTSGPSVDSLQDDPTRFEVLFNNATGLMEGLRKAGRVFPLSQRLMYYKGDHHWTGAYVFRPAENYAHAHDPNATWSLLSQGPVVTEYEMVFSPWASQVVRAYTDTDWLEVEWLVGPIPTEDYFGREAISRYATGINSQGVFYTDMNGRSLRERRRDSFDWYTEVREPVSGNYYPVTTHIGIKDKQTQMFVLTDRPQGGSSLADGEIELMVHRRLCYDDGKGVDEALNETEHGVGLVARGRHWLVFGEGSDKAFNQRVRTLSQHKHMQPWLFFSPTDLDADSWADSVRTQFSALSREMPPNVRILTLEPWNDQSVLLRLEHVMEKYPETGWAQPVEVNIKTLFTGREIAEARETALGADRWLDQVDRLQWIKNQGAARQNPPSQSDTLDPSTEMTVELVPMQIRTFILTFK